MTLFSRERGGVHHEGAELLQELACRGAVSCSAHGNGSLTSVMQAKVAEKAARKSLNYSFGLPTQSNPTHQATALHRTFLGRFEVRGLASDFPCLVVSNIIFALAHERRVFIWVHIKRGNLRAPHQQPHQATHQPKPPTPTSHPPTRPASHPPTHPATALYLPSPLNRFEVPRAALALPGPVPAAPRGHAEGPGQGEGGPGRRLWSLGPFSSRQEFSLSWVHGHGRCLCFWRTMLVVHNKFGRFGWAIHLGRALDRFSLQNPLPKRERERERERERKALWPGGLFVFGGLKPPHPLSSESEP